MTNNKNTITATNPEPELRINFDKKEVIKISREGFFYKGEKVEDIHNIYERFNDWLTLAERTP